MDQHVEKAENNFQESTDRDEEKEEGSAEESMDQRNWHKELAEEINKGSEEEAAAGTAASPRIAHPCSLLQYLLRACTGCLGLHCYCSEPKTAAVASEAAAPPANLSQEGDGGGKTNEVVTRARAVMRRPRAPGRPGEGRGGNGGNHH